MTAVYIIIGAVLFLALLTLFLIFPSPRKHHDLKLMEGMYIAHRGLHQNNDGVPENSLKAFEQAISHGLAIENDIHLTADGQVVVFHDDTLKRMCGVNKRPEDMTLDEIKSYPLMGTEQRIPTLKECLDLIDGKVPLLIEFKSVSLKTCTPLCRAANEILKDYKGKYFVQSFFPFVLRWYRKNRKDVCRGQLATSFGSEPFYVRILGYMVLNFISRPHFVSYDYRSRKNIMRRTVTRLGGYPVGWTFCDEDNMQNCKKDFKAYILEDFVPLDK